MLCVFLLTAAQVPIPTGGYDGFKLGEAGAIVQLEAFIDLACPGCKEAWPTIKAVTNAYGPKTLRLTVHTFPLPYHTWAFYLAQSAHVIGYPNVFAWFDAVFANQDSFGNDNQLDATKVPLTSYQRWACDLCAARFSIGAGGIHA